MPVKINGATNGSVTLAAPDTGSDVTLTLPSVTDTLLRQGGGKILQVVSVSTSTPLSTTSASHTDTGLSATITPTSTSSKVLILVSQSFYLSRTATFTSGAIYLLRGSTDIFGSSANDPGQALYGGVVATTATIAGFRPIMYLDSPNTTSATTYKTQQAPRDSGTMVTQFDSNASTMTLLEVSG